MPTLKKKIREARQVSEQGHSEKRTIREKKIKLQDNSEQETFEKGQF